MTFGRWLLHGGWLRSDQLRFFRADAWDRAWTMDLHSQVPVTGEILTLPAKPDLAIVHKNFNHVGEFVERALYRYAMTEARELLGAGLRPSLARMLWRPLKKFVGNYVIRRGFLDGMAGMLIAILMSQYVFLVEANLWSLAQSKEMKPH